MSMLRDERRKEGLIRYSKTEDAIASVSVAVFHL
jgi:hypothetical protein